MASCTVADVRALAPDFGSLDDAVISAFIGMADVQFNAEAFGTRATVAEANLVAHLLAVAYPSLYAGGPVVSQSVGGVSVTFAQPSIQAGDHSTSRFGLEYRRHVRLNGLGIGVI